MRSRYFLRGLGPSFGNAGPNRQFMRSSSTVMVCRPTRATTAASLPGFGWTPLRSCRAPALPAAMSIAAVQQAAGNQRLPFILKSDAEGERVGIVEPPHVPVAVGEGEREA